MSVSKGFGNLARFMAADTKAPQRTATVHRELIVPASLAATFVFFTDAANLPRITPPWLQFSIVTPMPVEMRTGLEIEYRITLYGLPIPWRSRIDVWEPGIRFVDRQIVGPYRWWRHDHRFEPAHGGTRVVDHVDYAPRAAWLSGALVRRDLHRIFAYRHEMLRRIFDELHREKPASSHETMAGRGRSAYRETNW